jgi:hypothetical protein
MIGSRCRRLTFERILRAPTCFRAAARRTAALGTVENRAVYAGGWRPQPSPGPSRDELADLVTAVVAAQ